MAESDPKRARPLAQTSDRRGFDSNDDPLIELARIVSEDGGFYGARSERPRPPHDEPVDRTAYSADLESELLQELETSFAARAAPRSVSPPPRQHHVAPVPQADDSDELLRSIEEQLGAFERRHHRDPVSIEPEEFQAQSRSASDPGDESGHVNTADHASEEVDQADFVSPSPVLEHGVRRDKPDEAPDFESIERQAYEPPPRQIAPRSEVLFGRGRSGLAQDQGEGQESIRSLLRRRDQSAKRLQDEAPLARDPAVEDNSGWSASLDDDVGGGLRPSQPDRRPVAGGYQRELRTTFGAFDEAETSASAEDTTSRRTDAEAATVLEPTYSDPTFEGNWDDTGFDRVDALPDEPRVAALPTELDRSPAAYPRRSRARTGLVAAAGLIGVLVIGGALAMMLRPGEQAPAGPPPVIAASEGQVKITAPQDDQVEAETAGEAVYQRVAGTDATAPADEQVVDGAEQPEEVARIVLPPPQTEPKSPLARPVGEDGTGETAVAAASPAADEPVAGPRRVRTFAIGPDGKILDTGNPPAPPPAPEQQIAATPSVAPIEPVPVPTTSIGGSPAAAEPDPATAPDLAAAFSPAEGGVASSNTGANDEAEPPAAALEPTGEALVAEVEAPSTDIAAAAPAEPAEVPVVEPEPQPEVAAVAPEPESEPLPAPTVAAGEGWSVQISSQRTREEAQSSWSSLSRRFSSVLGSLQPNVQEADLGTKGVYYRLRVGPWTSRSEAINLCESLRSAGGDCIVVR